MIDQWENQTEIITLTQKKEEVDKRVDQDRARRWEAVPMGTPRTIEIIWVSIKGRNQMHPVEVSRDPIQHLHLIRIMVWVVRNHNTGRNRLEKISRCIWGKIESKIVIMSLRNKIIKSQRNNKTRVKRETPTKISNQPH